ncbi:MAG: type III pantothenate kinase [Planctomycetaceae bacterium]|nr:type III pantothenate kinase [Planctomycetales bacterium]MCB9921483.1 type III pantothenate kinase [Planctomycetaceae bacterium]
MIPMIAVGIGNTTIKLGVANAATDGWQLMHEWDADEFDLGEIVSELPAEPCLWRVASVQRTTEHRLHQWQQKIRPQDDYLSLSYKDLSLEINVHFPERVGMDRLIAAVAVNERRDSERPAIIVDAGTAITVDLVDGTGIFQGGVILPGFRLSAQALADGTDQLPNVDATFRSDAPAVIGKSTTEAIRSGLFWGGVGAIRELVARTAAELDTSPQIFVTGGDAERLTGYLADDAQFVSDLVLRGIVLACR